jgi:inorganic pyrophosphatase
MNLLGNSFWGEMACLAASSPIVIDRAQGTAHPRHLHMICPLDDRALTGILCTFDTIKRDDELKLLLGCTDGEVQVIRAFLGNLRILYVPRPKEES